MKQLHSIFAAVVLFFCLSLAASAGTYPLTLIFSAGSGNTGLASSVQVTITDSAGTALVTASNNPSGSSAFTESSVVPGSYSAPYTVTTTNLPVKADFNFGAGTSGASAVYLTERAALVADGYTNGLTTTIAGLPNAAANATAVWSAGTRTITGGNVGTVNSLAPPVNWNLAAINGSGNVTIAGYASGQDPASLLLTTPANKLLTNASGYVTTSNPATGGSSVTEATIWAYGTRSLTAQADTPGTTTILGNYMRRTDTAVLPTTPPTGYGGVTGNVTVGGYASGQDPASLLFLTPANKLGTDSSGKVALTAAEHTLIGTTDVPAGLTAQGLTPTIVTAVAAQVARIYGAEWGSISQSGSTYSVSMPGGALTIPSAGSVLGTVAPSYDSTGRPTTTTKTVN